MGISNQVLRRGRYYVWRRRWRAQPVQVPLSTTDHWQARRLAIAATAASHWGWDLLDRGEADHQNVINAIRGAVAHEKAQIQFEAAEEDSALFFFEQFFLTADQICKDAATDVKQNPEDSIAGQQDQAAPVTPFSAVRDDADH